jgi:branched-chain amino acid transport system ATP-binding protein
MQIDEEEFLAQRAGELLEFVRLYHVAEKAVGDLPFGYQKRVELARALACEPKLIAAR